MPAGNRLERVVEAAKIQRASCNYIATAGGQAFRRAAVQRVFT
jgi:hypothetical protein